MSGQGAAQKARNMWRSLTSMGTALVLLFLLALAAIPGALLPQRGLNAAKVDDYLAAHPLIGPWLDELQAFDVFSSFWFTAGLGRYLRGKSLAHFAVDHRQCPGQRLAGDASCQRARPRIR